MSTEFMAIGELPFTIWLRIALAIVLFAGPGFATLSLAGKRRACGFPVTLALSLAMSVAAWAILLLWLNLAGVRVGAGITTVFFGSSWLVWLGRKLVTDRNPRPTADNCGSTSGTTLGTAAVFWLTMAAILAVSLWSVRSAFASPGSDSYHHTLIVQLMIDHGGIPSDYAPYAPLVTFFYHFGFHASACAFSWLSGVESRLAVALFSQFIIAAASLSVAAFIAEVSGSLRAGIIAAALSGLVCVFPSHMINWGRSAQLCGLMMLPMLLLCVWNYLDQRKTALPELPVAILAAGLALTHYRVALMGLFGGSILLLTFAGSRQLSWQQISRSLRRLVIAAGIGLAFLSPWILRLLLGASRGYDNGISPAGPSFFELNRLGYGALHYPTNTLFLAGAAICLAAGFFKPDKLFVAMTAWAALMLALSRLSPEFDTISVVISLYIPAVIVMGHLFNRMLGWLGNLHTLLNWAGIITLVSLSAWGGWLKLSNIEPGSHYVTREDLSALDWARRNIPDSSLFMVNTVRAGFSKNFIFGSDAGGWLPLLGHRSTIALPMSYFLERGAQPDLVDRLVALNGLGGDITSEQGQALLRKYGITHIYIGKRGRSLSADTLDASPAFHSLYRDGMVAIFSLDSQPTQLAADSSRR